MKSAYPKFVLCLLLVLSGIQWVVAQGISSPEIRCVAVTDWAGDVTITWLVPHDTNRTFTAYQVYGSTNKTTGPYIPLGGPVSPVTATSTTIPFASMSVNSTPEYFFVRTCTTHDTSAPIDTFSSMYLVAYPPGNGKAQLTWNPIHTPPLPSASPWYKIWRKYSYGTWTFIDSTQSLGYIDTITVCEDTISYQVTNADSDCVSSSNFSKNKFSINIAPPPPVIDTVSVVGSGFNTTQITWYRSPKNQVIGYIVYINIAGHWFPIDTVMTGLTVSGINDTTYNFLYFNSSQYNPDSASLNFCVAAVDSCGNAGTQSKPQNTIFLTESSSTCTQKNTLSWNPDTNLHAANYEILLSINSGPFSVLGTIAKGVTTYIDSNLNHSEQRCYYIREVDSGKANTTASSNEVCYTVVTATPPAYTYLNDASVINNSTEIMVTCYVDTIAGVHYYKLMRASDSGSKYQYVSTVPAPKDTSFITFIDNAANPNTQSWNYVIIGLDSCENDVDTTNIGQTVYLTAYGEANRLNHLVWNSYRHWDSGAHEYDVYRSEDGGNFSRVDVVYDSGTSAKTYILNDDVSQIATGYGIFSYYIMAKEEPETVSGYYFSDTSYSNIALAYQDPNVFIPTAFDPDGKNRVFYPVGVFINVAGYDLLIEDRWGDVLFESNNPETGWDGTYKGQKCAEGVYVYLLTYTSAKGEYFQRKGTVTLLK